MTKDEAADTDALVEDIMRKRIDQMIRQAVMLEREACAQIAEDIGGAYGGDSAEAFACEDVATKIRARP